MHFYALHLLGHQTVYGACSVPVAQQAADRYPAILLTTLDAAGDAAFEPYTGATLPYGWGALHHADPATEAECLEWSRNQRKQALFQPTVEWATAYGWDAEYIAAMPGLLAAWPTGNAPTKSGLSTACYHKVTLGRSVEAAVKAGVSDDDTPF